MLLQIPQNIKTITIRHVQIQQQQIDRALLQMPDNRIPIGRFGNLISILTQKTAQSPALER